MRVFTFIVICHFINGYSCAEISNHTEKDKSIGVCTVYGKEKENEITKTFDECCDGYYQEFTTNSTSLVCKPICRDETNYSPTSDDCVNGICTAPDECTCNDGFERKNGSSFVCHEKCKNGYVHDPETSECVSYCDGGCVNGRCVEPNKCKCNQGYNVTDRNKPNECHCGMYCAEVDGLCRCLKEDERINGLLIHNDTSSLCIETTSTNGTISQSCSCLNGFYTSNKTCVCVNGYKMREGFADLCEPDCEEQCIDGFCNEPNQCQCENGYELGHNENETNICYPICQFDIDETQGCGNGTCIDPNTCECYEGFENYSNNISVCVAKRFNVTITQSADGHSYILSLPFFSFFVGLFLGIIAALIFVGTLHFVTLCVIKERMDHINV